MKIFTSRFKIFLCSRKEAEQGCNRKNERAKKSKKEEVNEIEESL